MARRVLGRGGSAWSGRVRPGVIDSGSGILMKHKPSTADLAGSGSEHSTPAEMKRLLDKMRTEEA